MPDGLRDRSSRPLLALVPLLVLVACASLSDRVIEPEVHVVRVVPLERSAFEQRTRIDLRVQNPNDFDLRARGLRFTLSLNGEPFARGQTGETLVVPRLGEEMLSVVATTTVFDLVRQIGALAGAGTPDLDYRIDGTLFLEEPYERTVTFEREGRVGE